MNNETLKRKFMQLRDILYFDYTELPASAISLLDEIMDELENYDSTSYEQNAALTKYDFIDPCHKYRLQDCILRLPEFARQLVNTSSSTLNNYVLPTDVEQIIPAMRYTPTVLYLMVVVILIDINVPAVYNEVELKYIDYEEFRSRLATLLTWAVGADDNAVDENIYSVDEQIDLYEDFVSAIDDAVMVSVKVQN